MPLVYGTVFGLAVNLLELHLPTPIAEPARILGGRSCALNADGAGHTAGDSLSLEDVGSLSVAVFLRLVVSAGAGYLLTLALGIDGLLQQVLVVVSAMPTAVFTTILATPSSRQSRLSSPTALCWGRSSAL